MDLQSREQFQSLPAQTANVCDRILPLYSGPSVTIYIGLAGHKYTLPKALLCKQSPYFSAMFTGSFKEGEEQTATLELIDGVVSVPTFEMLVQWLCIGRIVFKEYTLEQFTRENSITADIELSRLADMCGIIGIEAQAAAHIRGVILALPYSQSICPGKNTYYITSAHIISAAHLPHGHAVRQVLAKASVEGYLRLQNHKFFEEAQCVASFSADLLIAVANTMKSIRPHAHFEDPISGKTMYLPS